MAIKTSHESSELVRHLRRVELVWVTIPTLEPLVGDLAFLATRRVDARAVQTGHKMSWQANEEKRANLSGRNEHRGCASDDWMADASCGLD